MGSGEWGTLPINGGDFYPSLGVRYFSLSPHSLLPMPLIPTAWGPRVPHSPLLEQNVL